MEKSLFESLPFDLDGIKAQSDSPVVKWSVLAMAVIVVWIWVIEPVQVWQSELLSQLDVSERKASRMLALEENADQWLNAEAEAATVYVDLEDLLFDARSDTQAQADIQNLLSGLANERGVSVVSQKAIPGERLGAVGVRLAVELGLRGELPALLGFIEDISRSEKLFVIDHLILQVDRRRQASARFTVAGIRPLATEVPDA